MDERTRQAYRQFLGQEPPDNLPYQILEKGVVSHDIGSQLRARNYHYCATCGGVIPANTFAMHDLFHRKIYAKETTNMSSVKWCDPGDHAFKAGMEGSASFQGTQMVNGVTESITQDMCPKHNPMRAEPETVRRELEKAYPVPTDDDDKSNIHPYL
jgi:hypothetical protein